MNLYFCPDGEDVVLGNFIVGIVIFSDVLEVQAYFYILLYIFGSS